MEIHNVAIYKKSNRHYIFNASKKKHDKKFVVFDIKMESHIRLFFFLSRDLIFARPLSCKVEPFQVSCFRFSFLSYTITNNSRKLRHFLNFIVTDKTSTICIMSTSKLYSMLSADIWVFLFCHYTNISWNPITVDELGIWDFLFLELQ